MERRHKLWCNWRASSVLRRRQRAGATAKGKRWRCKPSRNIFPEKRAAHRLYGTGRFHGGATAVYGTVLTAAPHNIASTGITVQNHAPSSVTRTTDYQHDDAALARQRHVVDSCRPVETTHLYSHGYPLYYNRPQASYPTLPYY